MSGERVREPPPSRLLVGRFVHGLDPKKRLTIPSGWRSQMLSATHVFVMPDFTERCLNLFAPDEMDQRLERLRQRAISDARAAAFARRVGEVSECLALDVQGRVRIRDSLLDYAGLTDQVVMIGALNRIELWRPELKPEMERIDLSEMAGIGCDIEF